MKVLNVDDFLYCKPKRFFPRCVALDLDAMQADTPCVHVYNDNPLTPMTLSVTMHDLGPKYCSTCSDVTSRCFDAIGMVS